MINWDLDMMYFEPFDGRIFCIYDESNDSSMLLWSVEIFMYLWHLIV